MPINRVDYNREWRERNPDKMKGRGCVRPQRPENPAKIHQRRARRSVEKALRSGRLTRPSCCSRCNREVRIVGHHEDYSRRLEVVWLCDRCHMRLHAGLWSLHEVAA